MLPFRLLEEFLHWHLPISSSLDETPQHFLDRTPQHSLGRTPQHSLDRVPQHFLGRTPQHFNMANWSSQDPGDKRVAAVGVGRGPVEDRRPCCRSWGGRGCALFWDCLHIFLTHCKIFRGFLCLWISLYCISLFFWPHESLMGRTKAVALTVRCSPFLSFSASWLRYQPELCSLPQLYGVSRSLPASKLEHSAHRPHSVRLPAWKSQRLPGRTVQKSGILKQCSFFPATAENRKALINTI